MQNLNVTNKFITNDNFKLPGIYVVLSEKENDHRGIRKNTSLMNFQYPCSNVLIKRTHGIHMAICIRPVAGVITQ
jgi:hypothetical protein